MLSMERKGRVIVATLSRAPVNALNDVLLARIEAALDDAVADEEVSVLHIRSGLKAFCAGADLALMQSCMSSPQGIDTMVEVVRGLQRVFARIESAPVLTLAEIGGAAMGGGLELALAEAKQCIAAQADPNRDGFELEIEVTRRLYAHPETRRRVSDFLKKSAS